MALLAALALIAAACGGDDDSSSASDPASASNSATEVAAEPTSEEEADDPEPEPEEAAPEPEAEPEGESEPEPEEPATVSVEHPGGITEVPTEVDTVLALDENAAYVMWELGVEPTTIYGSFFTVGTAAVAEGFGVEITPHDLEDPAVESAAQLAPDLIVGTDHPATLEIYDLWSNIAPVVLFPFAGAWQDQLQLIAGAFGAEDIAAARIAGLEAEIARVRDEIAAAYDTPPVVSVIGSLGGTTFAVASEFSAVADLLTELGLARPEAQMVEVSPDFAFIFFSEETIGDHDADVILTLTGGIYADLSELPTFGSLTGATHPVDGESFLASHPFAIAWILQDLESVLLGDGATGSLDDTLTRWQAYTG
ncbi:MAG: ABC transporter substrate-binding protein [Actinomycetota bacterium]